MSIKAIETGTNQLLCEVRDSVAIITLNRPKVRNALGNTITPALRQMIRDRGEDPDVGALLLTGSGTAFCAGGDVKGMGASLIKKETTREQKISHLKEGQRTLTGSLRSLRKPTVAAIPGPAAGAGLAIALACDIRIAARSAFITTGYANVGLSGDYGISWMLTQLVGTARARELMFTADRLEAKECERIGLINRVTSDTTLHEEAFSLAKRLANGPRIALEHMKNNLDDALTQPFLTALDREAERLIATAQTGDHKEAVDAFIEKRNPRFTGA